MSDSTPAGGTAPGRGKTPAERKVDVPAAPVTDLNAELDRRFGPKLQQLPGLVPDIHGRESNRIGLDAAPGAEVSVTDLTALLDRVTGMRSARSGRDDGIVQP